uniref:Zinc finger BED domain-containing protein RICESLEEPER 2-like n=1 Tax=Nicotiana sylvestris TaxID=4096 RepID=A0A1U7YKE6_NICSY|nr:PREDICTED: zinc finger BED domain-containing protein RICESLEEPER 2-like [Nicotiana sylvestris]
MCIIDYFREWGLQKIFTVIVDNSSNDVTVEKLSDKLDDWGTNSMNGQYQHSPTRLRKFQECCESENFVKKSLCLDVPTRWNSTYLMLSRAIEYERAIKEYSDHAGLSRYLMFDAILDGKPVGMLTRTDWDDMFGDEGTIIEKEVHTYMSSLFNEYVSKSVSKDTGGKVSTSLPNSSFSTMETSTPGLGKLLDEIRKHKAVSGGVDSKTELEKYLVEDHESERSDFDNLAWWKANSPRFPILAKMDRDVLAIPISSVASESAFSTGGRILDQFRSSLTLKLVETLILLILAKKLPPTMFARVCLKLGRNYAISCIGVPILTKDVTGKIIHVDFFMYNILVVILSLFLRMFDVMFDATM